MGLCDRNANSRVMDNSYDRNKKISDVGTKKNFIHKLARFLPRANFLLQNRVEIIEVLQERATSCAVLQTKSAVIIYFSHRLMTQLGTSFLQHSDIHIRSGGNIRLCVSFNVYIHQDVRNSLTTRAKNRENLACQLARNLLVEFEASKDSERKSEKEKEAVVKIHPSLVGAIDGKYNLPSSI